ncbi:LIM domain-containing protein WLIM2b-like [Mizuhopecten yessoensis]|uniref:Protein-methionine sulfoxide oxidase MICAL2 n=1 Tax=Mizuhopecten yessoensis TaxID=6573 RepID=A0A210QVM1_MIZYE|nr:LIM domain-containing protein WLIM2b-like [Mizuhopecten yessoensis]OWF52791.1 Protein-methionine sulfoxide oxidase MICAL2 [Mizuhopecten yessoensis]
MPPKFGGGGEKCVICEKSVYANERIEAGGVAFHKFCFKCSECKMQLNLNNYAQDAKTLYCKNHFASCVTAKNTQAPVF